MRNTIKKNSGQILVEVLVGLTVIVLSLSASYLVSVVSNELLLDKRLSDQAAWYMKEGQGAIESIRDRDWYSLAPGTHGLSFDGTYWNVSGTQDTVGSFTRQVTIMDTATHTKRIETKISWTGFPNIARQITSMTHLTNWTAEDLVFEDWLNPATIGSGDINPSGNKATDVAVSGNYAYITAEMGSVQHNDFFVFDISNPTSPSLVASINTGKGLDSISIKKGDNYAYVVSYQDAEHREEGFKVIDISNPANPSIAAEIDLSSTEAYTSVFALGNYAYVGSLNSSNKEFMVVNITAPTSPSETGSLEIGERVYDIWVYETRAYAATALDSKELIIIDVGTPSSPQEIGSYNWSDTTDAHSVYVQAPSRVMLGRGNWSGGTEFHIVDASNASSVMAKGSAEIGDDVNDIIAVDYLVFLATRNSTKELTIINAANISSPTVHSSLNYSAKGTGIDFEGNYVYVAVNSNDGLRIIENQ